MGLIAHSPERIAVVMDDKGYPWAGARTLHGDDRPYVDDEVEYVRADLHRGVVERIAELETEIVRLERDRSNLAKSALAHRQAGREEAGGR